MTETMTTSEVLNRAADHIQQYGHRKHGLGIVGEPCCALGALHAVTGVPIGQPSPGYGALWRYLEWQSVAPWNNHPERTAAEVIEALRACAVIESAREREPAEVAS